MAATTVSVCPGDGLGSTDELIAGTGTYAKNGVIFASMLGTRSTRKPEEESSSSGVSRQFCMGPHTVLHGQFGTLWADCWGRIGGMQSQACLHHLLLRLQKMVVEVLPAGAGALVPRPGNTVTAKVRSSAPGCSFRMLSQPIFMLRLCLWC